MWKVNEVSKIKAKKPILIEGLPGIGNVGKIVVDFLIDELETKKTHTFFSYSLPHTVFVNEDNLIDLPKIELYEVKDKPIILLAGDVQPVDGESSFAFSDKIIDLCEKHKVTEIITLGGIGVGKPPEDPKVFCTGNSEDHIEKYTEETFVKSELFGVVGPIIGVSGLLLGLSKRRDMPAVTLLAETYGHPLYSGTKGARKILQVLDDKLDLGVDIDNLEDEEQIDMEKLKQIPNPKNVDTSYIG